jgi:hypothetical protein
VTADKTNARAARAKSKANGKARTKGRQYRVDEIRLALSKESPELLAEFDNLCKYRASIHDLWAFLNDHGHQVHRSSVWQWYHATFPVGEEAKKINAIALQYGGLDTANLLNATLAAAILTFNEVRDEIKLIGVKGVKPEALLAMVPSLIREIRSLTDQIDSRQIITDRHELELAGAYTVLAELELTFKDTAFEQPFKDAKRGALAKLEGR